MAASDHALDRDALRLWTRALDVRLVTLTAVALTSPWMPALQEHRLRDGTALFVILVPYSFLLSFRIRRRGRLDGFLPVTDILLAVFFAARVPETWPAVLGVAVADVAFAVVMFGRRMAVVATLVAAAGLALTATRTEHSLDAGVIGFLTACAIVITTVGSVTVRERALRRSYTGLVNGVDGIVFELDAAATS